MAICIVKDMSQLRSSSSNLVDQYKVNPKKIVSIIQTRGLDYFIEKYRGAFMFGIDSEGVNEFYARNSNKTLDIPMTRLKKPKDSTSKVLFRIGKHVFTSSDFEAFIEFLDYNSYENLLNDNVFGETSRSRDSLANMIYDSIDDSNLYVATHFNYGSFALQDHTDTDAVLEYTLMKINDMKQVFNASSDNVVGNQIYDEIYAKLVKNITDMEKSINSNVAINMSTNVKHRIQLLEASTDGVDDPKMFSKLLKNKNNLIDFLKNKLPAYDASLDDQKMSRIIASVKSNDSNYFSLRVAIKRESSNDQLYDGLMGYHNFFGFYHFINKLSGYDASIAQSRKASQINPSSKEVASGEISYFESSKNHYNDPGVTPDEFIVNELELVSIVNNLVKSGDIDRSKELIMVLNYKYKADRSVKRYSLNTISGKGAAANKKLAVTLKVQIERIGAISVVTGQKPSVLKIKIPAASINESFYKEFAKILKNSVRNSF